MKTKDLVTKLNKDKANNTLQQNKYFWQILADFDHHLCLIDKEEHTNRSFRDHLPPPGQVIGCVGLEVMPFEEKSSPEAFNRGIAYKTFGFVVVSSGKRPGEGFQQGLWIVSFMIRGLMGLGKKLTPT